MGIRIALALHLLGRIGWFDDQGGICLGALLAFSSRLRLVDVSGGTVWSKRYHEICGGSNGFTKYHRTRLFLNVFFLCIVHVIIGGRLTKIGIEKKKHLRKSEGQP
jgi:hypothetical protein